MTTFRPTPRMRQVTSLDAHFIAVEDGKVHGHVSALAIYDPSTSPGGLSLDVVRDLVAERVRLLAPFRWRLAEVPFGLDHLCWFEDPNLDLVYHIRQLALPADGNEQLFAEQVARLIARSLDRARPLWELYLIHGLEHGRVAVLTKLHHAAVDGVSGAEILNVLLDPTPEGRDIPAVATSSADARMPGQLQMLGGGMAGLPMQSLRSLRGMRSLLGVAALAATCRHATPAILRTLDSALIDTPNPALGQDSSTPANGRRYKCRRERRGGRSTPSRRSRRAAAGSA